MHAFVCAWIARYSHWRAQLVPVEDRFIQHSFQFNWSTQCGTSESRFVIIVGAEAASCMCGVIAKTIKVGQVDVCTHNWEEIVNRDELKCFECLEVLVDNL